MKKKIFFCMTAVLVLLSSCIVVQANSYEAANDESRAYPLRDFSAIEVSGAINVEFVQSNNQNYRVKAVGSPSMLPKLQMEVRNQVLTIKQKSDPGFHSGNNHLTVYVQAPNLQSVKASGACDVLIRSLNASAVRLEARGSSDVKVNQLTANSLEVWLQGSSDARLAGKVSKAIYTCSGSSDVRAYDLKAEEVSATCSGSSDVYCFATRSVSAKASGSSDIRIKGNPIQRQLDKSGSSDIHILH